MISARPMAEVGTSGSIVKLAAAIFAGPLHLRKGRPFAALLLALITIGLTLLNPVGGVLLWLSSFPLARLTSRLRSFRSLAAAGSFARSTSVHSRVVPRLGRLFGRTPLPCLASQEAPLGPQPRLLPSRAQLRADGV